MTTTSSRTPEPPAVSRPLLPPPFPAVVLQLIRQMQQPMVTAGEVARLIELDPSLTAALLRLVNSPFFGMRREIGNVSDAVMVMGMSAVRRQVLSLAVAAPLRRSEIDVGFARQQWHAYVSCAALARHLVPGDAQVADLAFTSGLLHDIGQVHLLQAHGDVYVQMHKDATSNDDLLDMETEQFGEAHDTLGGNLLEAWGLPKALSDAARHHHRKLPLTELSMVEKAVWIANLVEKTPEQAAEGMLHFPGMFNPLPEAIEEARIEIESLSSLMND